MPPLAHATSACKRVGAWVWGLGFGTGFGLMGASSARAWLWGQALPPFWFRNTVMDTR